MTADPASVAGLLGVSYGALFGTMLGCEIAQVRRVSCSPRPNDATFLDNLGGLWRRGNDGVFRYVKGTGEC